MTPSSKLRELADERPLMRVSRGEWVPCAGGERDPKAWRVEFWIDTRYFAVKTPFTSRRDADLAMKALLAAGIATADDAIKAGFKRCNQIMCEALPW